MRRVVLTGLIAAALATPIPASAQAPPPLDVAIVIEIAPDPLIGADGQPLPETRDTLGRLTAAFDGLERTDVPVALSVSPVFLDQLRLLGSIGARPYAALLRLASGRPLLSRPFADVHLPHLDGTAAVRDELRRGVSSLRETLDIEPLPILHAPILDLSETALRAARDEELSAALASTDDVGGRAIRAHGVPLVPADRITFETEPLAERILRNHVLVAVVLDALDPSLSDLGTLPADDRINLVRIGDLVGSPPDGRVRFTAGLQPPTAYKEAVRRAAASFDAYASYTLEGNPTRDTLSVLLSLARSSAHWLDQWHRARDLASTVVDRISEERDLVTASQGSVTLTSQRGTVPVTVINLARYPVRVRVRVTSPKLSFPEGATRVLTVSPQGDTITFIAQARSPGTFPMAILVSSPDGSVQFDGSEVLVRSVAARTPALVLTAGAALFLLVWSSRGFLRHRRSRNA